MIKTALVEEILEKVSEKENIKVPIDVQQEMGNTRIIVDMTDIAEILEDRYNGVKGRTEIQMGKGNEVIFDLERST